MRRALITLIILLLAGPAFAREMKGVNMPETISVEGRTLLLNGMGLRTKVVFKVYVAGLYLEEKIGDPAAILARDQVRRVDLHMLRDLEKDKIVEAIVSGFEKNSGDRMAALKDRLARFTAVIPDLKEGQVLMLSYVPGRGTNVKGPAGAEVTVEGKDFADALFAVWLGRSPVDEDLKKGLLGK